MRINDLGARKKMTRLGGNNTITSYTFLDTGLLDSLVQNINDGNINVTFGYTYNRANQITGLAKSNQNYQYSQNNHGVESYKVNGLNQYTQGDGNSLTYDTKANLTFDGTMYYQYDVENRLLSGSDASTASFGYDPKGRLFKSTINGTVREYQYDSDVLVAEYNASDILINRFVHGDRVDEPLVRYEGSTVSSSVRYFYHSDHKGNVIAETNNNGNVSYINTYNEFGIPNTANSGRFGFTGQMALNELGLFYYKARIYHPKLGRFLQTDPIGYEDQMNLYAYVGNDPINNIDPTGKVIFTLGGQLNGNAGLSGAAAKGKWLNISTKGISWGSYQSGEAGSAVASPSVGAGFESTVFFTSDTDAALKGMYMVNGVDAAQVSGDVVTTLPAKGGEAVLGLQLSVDVNPSTDVGVHNRSGYGTYATDGEKSWGQIATDVTKSVVDSVKKWTEPKVGSRIKRRVKKD